jgi:hypothetical protein
LQAKRMSKKWTKLFRWASNGLHKECSNQINNLPLLHYVRCECILSRLVVWSSVTTLFIVINLKWRYKRELVQPPYNLPSYMLKDTTLQNFTFFEHPNSKSCYKCKYSMTRWIWEYSKMSKKLGFKPNLCFVIVGWHALCGEQWIY